MPREPAPVTSTQIASYYDRNTHRFLQLGGSETAGAIHRQIWAPGVSGKEQALTHINRLVAAEIQLLSPGVREARRVLDLGCGVGGTATWLAESLEVEVLGVTNSAIQQQIANRRAEELGLGNRCRFLQADFSDFEAPGCFDAVVMVESFTHALDPASLLTSIREVLLPGGRLVIADDFIAQGVPTTNPWLQQFQRGWHLNSLMTVDALQSLADAVGLKKVKADDLTAFIRLLPWFVLNPLSWISRLPFSQVYWQNLMGGIALQVCIRRGFSRYHFMVWEKPLESPTGSISDIGDENLLIDHAK